MARSGDRDVHGIEGFFFCACATCELVARDNDLTANERQIVLLGRPPARTLAVAWRIAGPIELGVPYVRPTQHRQMDIVATSGLAFGVLY
jgi:hypothetical protein